MSEDLGSDNLNHLKEMEDANSRLNAASQTCPACGYCRHCGRRGAGHWGPWHPWPQVTWGEPSPQETTAGTTTWCGPPLPTGTQGIQ